MYTDVELDKPRRLRFDLAAIKTLESSMGGKPLGQIVNELSQMSLTALCLALVSGLKHDDPTLNVNLVTKMLSDYLERGGTLDTVYGAVKDALDGSGLFRTAEDMAEGNGRPERTPVG